MQSILPAAFLADALYIIVIAAAAVAIAASVNRFVGLLAHRFRAPALGARPLRQFVTYSVLVVAVLIVLNRFGFDTNAILAVAGTLFGLVAIGFVAVWSVLSNFLCALVLLVFRPFRAGDEVSVPGEGVSGTVKEIALVFTVLESSEGEHVYVPNNMFFQKVFKKAAPKGS